MSGRGAASWRLPGSARLLVAPFQAFWWCLLVAPFGETVFRRLGGCLGRHVHTDPGGCVSAPAREAVLTGTRLESPPVESESPRVESESHALTALPQRG